MHIHFKIQISLRQDFTQFLLCVYKIHFISKNVPCEMCVLFLWIPFLRVLDMSHGLIQQTKEKHRQAFGIVKERIVTSQPCSVIEEVQQEGQCGGGLSFCGPKNPKVHCQYYNVLVKLKCIHWNVFIMMKCNFLRDVWGLASIFVI